MARPDRRINLAVARAIPPFLLCVFIYASYAVTKPLCIDYLIHPLSKYDHGRRTGAGVAILVIYYILLLIVLTTYLRLLHTVTWNAGLLPRKATPPADDAHEPPHSSGRHRRRRRRHRRHRSAEKTNTLDRDVESEADSTVDGDTTIPWDTNGLESFYTKDVFVCQPDGRPLYCSTCCHYKPDRTHHCREVDQCVRKMDHFCPWVGGVVSETSFKFFIQFVFYTMLYCIFCLIVCALFTAEIERETGGANPHLAVGIGLSGLFGLFTFGMTLSSLQLAMLNLTTIENINRRSAVWTLAIRVPNHLLSRLNPDSRWAPTFNTITYPLPPMPLTPEAQRNYQPPAGEQHIFAILQTLPGENPFDLGSPFRNLQQVLGYKVIDWFVPLKQSPCAVRTDSDSFFEFGPVVSRLKREAGLEKPALEEARQ